MIVNLVYTTIIFYVITPHWFALACIEDVPIVRCGSTEAVFITENVTHIVTSNTSNKCRFVISKEPGICQVRLDLQAFDVGEADSLGDCNDNDVMTITGSPTVKNLAVCGNLTSQHMYLDFGDSDKIEVRINQGSDGGLYDIKLTQLKCSQFNRAPPYCLQYFNAQRGTVKSFNYPRQQLNNQEYTICVEAESGSEAIQWKPCEHDRSDHIYPSHNPNSIPKQSSVDSTFFITGSKGKGKFLIPGPLSGNQCGTDFVEVFGENRQCGSSFMPVTSPAKPYLLRVNFDSTELPLTPFPPILSLPMTNVNAHSNKGRIVHGSNGGICPDMSALGLICTPPPMISCDGHGNELGSRRGKDPTICTCTSPSMSTDSMNIGFCLDFIQI